MAFNFLTGQPMQSTQPMQGGQGGPQNPQAAQLYQMLQQAQQPTPGANIGQWAQNPAMAAPPSQMPQAQLAGNQTMPSYAQNPLSNQGANGFSLGDYLQRAQSNGLNTQMALGGLQMMLKGWGSHS